jgi:hypothetical protein
MLVICYSDPAHKGSTRLCFQLVFSPVFKDKPTKQKHLVVVVY